MLEDHTLRIQVCPKEGINPTILLWGWDWDHQSYSREGSGFLGILLWGGNDSIFSAILQFQDRMVSSANKLLDLLFQHAPYVDFTKIDPHSQRSSQKIPKANSCSPKIGPKRNMFLGSLIPLSWGQLLDLKGDT